MQTIARVKEARGKGQEKSLKRAIAKEKKKKKKTRPKKSKFLLMRMHKIKIFHIFVPNLGEIYQFGQE